MNRARSYRAAYDVDENFLDELAGQEEQRKLIEVQRIERRARWRYWRLLKILDVITNGNLEEILERGKRTS
jgi:hypothetical protein